MLGKFCKTSQTITLGKRSYFFDDFDFELFLLFFPPDHPGGGHPRGLDLQLWQDLRLWEVRDALRESELYKNNYEEKSWRSGGKKWRKYMSYLAIFGIFIISRSSVSFKKPLKRIIKSIDLSWEMKLGANGGFYKI